MCYHAVIFDLYGTLVPWCKHGFLSMVQDMAAELGVDAESFDRVMDELGHQSMAGRFASLADEVAHICSILDICADSDSIDRAVSLWMEFHRRGFDTPYPHALDTLRRIREMGFVVGLISNCNHDTPLLWPQSQLAPLVDVAAFSVTEGLVKPDLRIFENACRKLQVDPENCLYIDDSIPMLTGAAKAGLQPLLIRHSGNTSWLAGLDQWTGPRLTSLSEVMHHVAGIRK